MSDNTVVLFYTGNFCKSCDEAKVSVELVSSLVDKVLYIDVDKEFKLAEERGVILIPTVIVLKDNLEVARFLGREVSKVVDYFSIG